MKKYIALYGIVIATISSGNAFGTTSLTKCCSGNTCTSAYVVGCKTCTTNFDCEALTTCPDECPNTIWTLVDVGGMVPNATPRYETRCVSGTCEYRCASGSYGNPTSSTSGCSRCPSVSSGSSGGMLIMADYGNSDAGATDITDCYAEADTEYYDSTGTFKFTKDCKYTE